jgi:hypothetical protein
LQPIQKEHRCASEEIDAGVATKEARITNNNVYVETEPQTISIITLSMLSKYITIRKQNHFAITDSELLYTGLALERTCASKEKDAVVASEQEKDAGTASEQTCAAEEMMHWCPQSKKKVQG